MKFGIKRASSMKSHSVTSSGVGTDGHIPWREWLDLIEIEALSDNEGFDDLLDAVGEGEGVSNTSIRRVPVAPANFHRHDPMVVTAATTNWDTEFENAQAHARSILASLSR